MESKKLNLKLVGEHQFPKTSPTEVGINYGQPGFIGTNPPGNYGGPLPTQQPKSNTPFANYVNYENPQNRPPLQVSLAAKRA